MKYSILGFNQQLIMNTSLDLTDLLLLKYIHEASGRIGMSHTLDNDDVYTWLSHKKIMEDLPILRISEGTLRNRILKLKQGNYIQSITMSSEKGKGSRTYYRLTDISEAFLYDNTTTSCQSDVKDVPHHVKVMSNNIELSNKEDNKLNYNKYDPEQKKSGQSQHSHTLIDTMVNQSPKISLYDKCINLIYSSTDSPAIRKSLIDFLNSISEQGKLKGFVQFKGILDKLFRLAGDDEDKTLLMIEYSIEKGYCTFYSINENQYNQRKKRGHASRDIEGLDPDKIVRATAEQKKQFKEDIANGKAERF